MGYASIASIDATITVMMCFVLYKNRLEIGIDHISRHSNRLLLNLITYALATGLITTLAAIVGLVTYIARPDTFLYIAVMFSITRRGLFTMSLALFTLLTIHLVYANSFLAMLNVRRRLNNDLTNTELGLKPTSDVIFRGFSLPTSSSVMRTRRDNLSNAASKILRTMHVPTIRTQRDTESKPEVTVEDEVWGSAKNSSVSSKTLQWSPQSRSEKPWRRSSL
ncbi:hypothetical protein AN958_02635 [Leucoagaricus sp. SymC.cos]|nr:hypothetical protein AN958_02635 [Leucoagaricus sp. SymC.cos]